jgi:hypothetical protein
LAIELLNERDQLTAERNLLRALNQRGRAA